MKPWFNPISEEPWAGVPISEEMNPVITAADVTDAAFRVDFVADPQILRDNDGMYHCFFEISEEGTSNNAISHSTSTDFVNWNYDQVIIDQYPNEAFPYAWTDTALEQTYMAVPGGSGEDGRLEVSLYKKGDDFSTWTEINTDLFRLGVRQGDTVFLRKSGVYYAWLADYTNNQLRLLYNTSGDPESISDWTEHPSSPVQSGGNFQPNQVFAFDQGRVALFRNNDLQVTAFEITTLTPTNYTESSVLNSAVLQGVGTGWNSKAMHEWSAWWDEDIEKWCVLTDGRTDANSSDWCIGSYTMQKYSE